MDIVRQDFGFALRTLRKSPAFTLVALLTLALSIGVNTAMFSVANAVLWRSLPYADAERIVWVGAVDPTNADINWGASYPNFRDWQTRAHSFERMAATLEDERILRNGAEPTRVSGLAVTHEFFEILGVRAAAGRVLAASDEIDGAPPAIVVSDRFWKQRFGGNPAMVGSLVRFDNATFTVAGIMPPEFRYRETEYWLPLARTIDRYFATHRDVWVLDAIARLGPGQTAAQAQREMEALTRQIRREHPDARRELAMRVNPLRVQLGKDLRPAVLALMTAVALVLLIACANLAGLMSIRAAARG